MRPHVAVSAEPRTVGEILDDAWRLYLADAPALLAVSGVVQVPCAALLLVLLTLDPAAGPGWVTWLIPAGLAVLLPLTGLTAGLCQEVYHRWGEKQRATLRLCLRATLARGLNHVTAQAVLLPLPVAALLCLFSRYWPLGLLLALGSLPLWAAGLTWHVVLTGGQRHAWKAFRYARRCAGQHPEKTAALVAARLGLLGAAVLNLHLFLTSLLWVLEQLAGLSFGAAGLVLSLGNLSYLFTLGALAWWLLTPYAEAVHYLFYVDARTRYEGLDLWYRVEQLFPVRGLSRAGAVLLAAGLALLTAAAAGAQERADALKDAQRQVAALRAEAETADPYPGGKRWQPRLRETATRLDPNSDAGRGRYRWLHQAADTLGARDRAADLDLLKNVETRLGLAADSLARAPRPRSLPPDGGAGVTGHDVRALVPPLDGELEKVVEPEPKKAEPKKPQEDGPGDQGPFRAGPKSRVGLVAPAGAGQVVTFLLYGLLALIAAVAVAALALAAVYWIRTRQPRTQPKGQGELPTTGADEYLDNPDRQDVPSLWQRADELARAGRHLDALRTLYLAVLALLHQTHLIRYERTRTNGEYADQLRPRALLHPVFLRLTGLFELKWYGERSCAEPDYQQCRALAERLQEQARSAAAGS